MPVSFYGWLEEQEVELKEWQQDIAESILSKMKPFRLEPAAGKTFVISLLSRFIYEHGNNYYVGEKAITKCPECNEPVSPDIAECSKCGTIWD